MPHRHAHRRVLAAHAPNGAGSFSRQDVSQHEFEEIDRSARRRRADVVAEDQGSDGRGCGDGAREASESGLLSLWRSQLGAAVVPITRTPRPFSPPSLRPAPSPTPTTPTPTAPRPPLSDVARRHNTRPNTRQKASSPPTPAHHAARLMRALSSHTHARRPRTSRAARPLLLLPW